MCFVSKDGIAYIIVMRNLYFVKQNHVLKFRRISDYRALADDRIAADKRAVAHLRIFPDDRRSMNISGRCDGRGSGDPDILSDFLIFLFGKCAAQL